MNGYERMMVSLRRGESDMVPVWELIIDEPVRRALDGEISLLDFVEKEDIDGITCSADQPMKKISDQVSKDEWGILWRTEPSGLTYPVGGPIRSERDLERYDPPDPDSFSLLSTLQECVSRFEGERAAVFMGNEAFEFSHYLVGGMDKLFLAYHANPGFALQLADMVSDYFCRLLENAANAGADVLVTGDDYAARPGPFMSPEHFKKFVLPYLQRAVDVAKNAGVPFIKHTDGLLWLIIDDIVDTGINALHPIEPMAGMDIGEVKRRYGDRICVVGNVDCSQLLPRGSKGEVEEAVKETIAKASPGGGHILSSSNSIHPAVKPENYMAMLNAARQFGRYPLDEEMVDTYIKRDYCAKYRFRSS